MEDPHSSITIRADDPPAGPSQMRLRRGEGEPLCVVDSEAVANPGFDKELGTFCTSQVPRDLDSVAPIRAALSGLCV